MTDISTLKGRVEAAGHTFPKLTSVVCLNPHPTGYQCLDMAKPGLRDRSAWALYNCRTGDVIAFFDTETFAPVKI